MLQGCGGSVLHGGGPSFGGRSMKPAAAARSTYFIATIARRAKRRGVQLAQLHCTRSLSRATDRIALSLTPAAGLTTGMTSSLTRFEVLARAISDELSISPRKKKNVEPIALLRS